MGHRLGLATRTQISVRKSPFPSAGTAVSLLSAKTVQQRPLLPRHLTVRSTPANVKCYSYHACTSVIVSGGVGMQQCMIRNQNEMHKLSKV